MKDFLKRRWFLVVLAVLLLIGLRFPEPVAWLTEINGLRQFIVCVVLFLMAFPLKADAMWRALRRPGAPLLASVLNYGLLPLVAWGFSLGIADIDSGLQYGIIVAAATPSTLASASVWTRRAGGNDASSILVTIITNLFCFLITPMWLLWIIGEMPKFDPWEMIVKLGLLVVTPMALAQALRTIKPVAVWATANKTPMGVIAQIGVLTMIFLGAIRTGLSFHEKSDSQVLGPILWMVAIVMSVHVVMLVLGIWLARQAGMPYREQIAVGFSGSQKTCMVGLEVCAQLGITMLPMVAYHVGQLLIDTVVADRWREKYGEKMEKEE